MILDMYVGTHSTDPATLSRVFQRQIVMNSPNILCRSIFVPTEIYDLYWESYDRATRLVESIDAVMADGDHALILEEAQSLGYRLPDMEIFKEDAAIYRQALENLQIHTARRSSAGYVEVPVNIAMQLNDLMEKNCHMITRVFDACFNTEYLKHFTFCRESGIPYMGPNALQSSIDLLVSMIRTIKEVDRQVNLRQPTPNWEALIAGNREDFLKPRL